MYQIIRFWKDGFTEVITKGLTLEQAQGHCSSELAHGEGWFDGYEVEG